MFNSPNTPDKVWASLLFKIASIPFLGLLLALVASQLMSLHDYTPEETGPGSSSVFVDATTF